MKQTMLIINILTLIVLALTFIVLIWYAYDTHRIANQTVQSNLRPIILRSGQIVNWNIVSLEDMEEKRLEPTLEFTNLKNIAVDISGYIILNNKKYALVFHSNVRGSKLAEARGSSTISHDVYNQKWGWLAQDDTIVASYQKTSFVETKEKNRIYLWYKDVESNGYFTNEDENNSPTSKEL